MKPIVPTASAPPKNATYTWDESRNGLYLRP